RRCFPKQTRLSSDWPKDSLLCPKDRIYLSSRKSYATQVNPIFTGGRRRTLYCLSSRISLPSLKRASSFPLPLLSIERLTNCPCEKVSIRSIRPWPRLSSSLSRTSPLLKGNEKKTPFKAVLLH